MMIKIEIKIQMFLRLTCLRITFLKTVRITFQKLSLLMRINPLMIWGTISLFVNSLNRVS
jgi:hypothetical protein